MKEKIKITTGNPWLEANFCKNMISLECFKGKNILYKIQARFETIENYLKYRCTNDV